MLERRALSGRSWVKTHTLGQELGSDRQADRRCQITRITLLLYYLLPFVQAQSMEVVRAHKQALDA